MELLFFIDYCTYTELYSKIDAFYMSKESYNTLNFILRIPKVMVNRKYTLFWIKL